MQKADEIYFNELVQKYMADEFTEAQAKYLAYKEMEFPIPDDIRKKVYDEETTLDMTGGFLPLKIKKKIKNNPGGGKRKYNIDEISFRTIYEKYPGNYSEIERQLLGISHGGRSLFSSVQNLKWWSEKKYPRNSVQKANRKYDISEDEFIRSYETNNGSYSAIEKDILNVSTGGSTLLQSLKNIPWWSIEKFPTNKRNKYEILESEFISYYEKNNGNYAAMEKEILNVNFAGASLASIMQKYPWWSFEKYPRRGVGGYKRKYIIKEEDFKESYTKNKGNYALMEKELLAVVNNGRTLYNTVNKLAWWRKEKYPRTGKQKALTPKKKFNRGQYQNAVSMALASKIGMNVEAESDKEISADADLLLKDILDLASEGLSIEKIAEELNIEKAIVKRALEGQVQKKSNPEITYENSEELRGFINSLNDNEKKVFDFIKKRKKPYNLPKELYSTYNKLLEKYSLFLSNNVFVDGKRINIDSLDLDKNILLKEFSNPNIFYSIDESKKGKDYKKNTGMVLFLFAKELDKYSPYDIAEMVEYGLYKRTASVFMDESQNELFEKNVVSIIEYKYQPCEVPGCENMNEIYIAAMSTNPSYARNKIMVFLLIKLMKEYNTKILNFGFTYSDGEELLKYLNSKGIANVYSLKAPLVIKPNPIKSQKTASGDIRVFRTEDDKFVTVKKEKGCYGVYPDGKQFKRIGAPNKQAALAKAREILMRKNNPGEAYPIRVTSVDSLKVGDKVQFLMPKIVTKQKIRSSDGARINIPFHVGFFDELFTEATVEDIDAESGKIQLSSDQSGLEVMTLDIGLFIKSRVYRKSRPGEARKNNPDESMGIKRSHEDVSEVGEDIKQLIVSLYTGGESIERIARRVDLNQSGVRQILEDNNVTIRKGGWKEKVKPNPKRKYFISEEIFSESYTRNQGNYGAIARELIPGHHGDSSTLISSVEGSKWWNREKYPPRGTIRKYIFTEEEINNVYNKYDGDYSKMEKELIPGVNRFGATLYNSIRKAPWFSKYPRKERKSKTGQLNMSKKERKSNPFFSLVEDQKKNN